MRHSILSTILVAAAQSVNAQTPASTIFNPSPSRIVGQAVLQQQGLLTAAAPNLVEGREFNNPQALAIDTSASPPILYVADTGNNRVLAWKNASGFTKGDFADKVIGQRDFFTTAAQGPAAGTSALSTGMTGPVALAVDKSGNLYVVDAGNNRILRYPAPLLQSGDLLTVDLIIGQKDFSGRSPNEGQSAPSEKTLALASGGSIFRAGITFDSQGNLWVSDPGNNRVLRYPASALGTGAANEPSADMVLGQTDFASNQIPPNSNQSKCGTSTASGQKCGRNFLFQPSTLAFDPKGRLFVADDVNRVVVFTAPFSIGQLIARIMGVVLPTPQQPTPPVISDSTLGAFDSSGRAVPPAGVFFVGNNPYVVDTGNARILGYDPFDRWADEGTAFSPPAKILVGQTSFQAYLSNRTFTQPTAFTLAGPQPNPNVSGPVAATFAGTDLFVLDAGNQRLLVFPQQSDGSFNTANRLLGQLDFQYNSVNLIEGREVGFTSNFGSCVINGLLPFSAGGSVVIDANSTPPHLYIADPLNNRVLGYLDYRKANAGAKADLVIGQPDLLTALVNYPSNNPTQTSDQGLWSPEGLIVDSDGNLYVADACNARVLRFPKPFTQAQGAPLRANLVLGQLSFTGQPIKDVSRQTMKSSYGLALTANGSLVVSDPAANRILFFRKPAGGDFQSGAPATNVFGQPDFSSSFPIVFSNPHLISIDPDDQLYVADTGNSRVAILPYVPTANDNPPVLFSIAGLSSPYGVVIDQTTAEIWVTNTLGNQVQRYPKYQLVISNPVPTATLGVIGPLAVTLDPFGNPVIAEGINRVSFYFPAIDASNFAGGVPGRYSGNGANYFGRFAPGMLASIFPFPNKRFGDQTVSFDSLPDPIPIPTTLGDIQVLVAGVAAPVLYASPIQINFQVPGATPVGGFQEIQVVRASTGQVLASWLFRFDTVSPGLFTSNSTGSGQVAATNEDKTVNNGAHPAKAGSVVTLYATGQGVVDGMPPDGQLTPTDGLLTTPLKPKVFINADFVPDADVQFSGLAPGLVGVWQINVKVPLNVPPGDVPVYIDYQGINSVLDPNGVRRTTTIRVTP